MSGAPLTTLADSGQPEPRPTGPAAVAPARALPAELMGRGEFREALALLQKAANESPQDPFVRYNLACALAMLGERDRSAESLLDALSLGFTDLLDMQRDAHLEPIRDHPTYQTIVRNWRTILDARAKAERDAAARSLGTAYTASSDDGLRLGFVSAADPRSFEEARDELQRVAAWAREHVLGEGVETRGGGPDGDAPDPWVLVLLPTPRDFAALVGAGDIGGYYDRDHKRLICQDLGPSLRHEFFHVLHWRVMDRLGQRHPYWIMEGLASLLEDVDLDDDGRYVLAPSWRTNIAKRLERANRLTPWKTLFSMGRDAFMGDRARGHYAEARAVALFLHEKGVLRPWFASYTGLFLEDATGTLALERVLDRPISAIELDYRAWLRALPTVAEQSRPGEAGLGVELGPGTGDGPVVAEVVAVSRARSVGEERLRLKDVITAIDGRQVRTLDDLHRVLSDAVVGQIVRLDVRRGTRRLTVSLELVAATADRSGQQAP